MYTQNRALAAAASHVLINQLFDQNTDSSHGPKWGQIGPEWENSVSVHFDSQIGPKWHGTNLTLFKD